MITIVSRHLLVVYSSAPDLFSKCSARRRSNGCAFSEGLACKQITRKEGQGKGGDWAAESGMAVPLISLG
jgi:hypothetical protein